MWNTKLDIFPSRLDDIFRPSFFLLMNNQPPVVGIQKLLKGL